jgi:hypothetical protein
MVIKFSRRGSLEIDDSCLDDVSIISSSVFSELPKYKKRSIAKIEYKEAKNMHVTASTVAICSISYGS